MPVMFVFSAAFRGQLLKGIQVERTIFVNAFVDVEVFTVLFLNKGVPAVRAYQSDRFKIRFTLVKPKATDLTQKLATASGIIIDVCMRRTTAGTNGIRGYRLSTTGFDRLEVLAMLYPILLKKQDVVQLFHLLNTGKLVNGQLIILGACKIVLWGL